MIVTCPHRATPASATLPVCQSTSSWLANTTSQDGKFVRIDRPKLRFGTWGTPPNSPSPLRRKRPRLHRPKAQCFGLARAKIRTHCRSEVGSAPRLHKTYSCTQSMTAQLFTIRIWTQPSVEGRSSPAVRPPVLPTDFVDRPQILNCLVQRVVRCSATR